MNHNLDKGISPSGRQLALPNDPALQSDYQAVLSRIQLPENWIQTLETRIVKQTEWLREREERWDVHEPIFRDDRIRGGGQILRTKDEPHEFANWIRIGSESDGIPIQYFALTKGLLSELKNLHSEKGSQLSVADALQCMTAYQGASLTPFTNNALNQFDRLFYGLPESFLTTVGPAPFFQLNQPFGSALVAWVKLLARDIREDRPFRIKELSSGKRTGMWEGFSHLLHRQRECLGDYIGHDKLQVDITLSDFSLQVLPKTEDLPKAKGITFNREAHNLFEECRFLEPDKRYDMIVSTYGFDSVWLPGDMEYEKVNGKWFTPEHRISVPDWHPNRVRLLETAKAGGDLEWLGLEDIRALQIDTTLLSVDLLAQPHGAAVEKRFAGKTSGKVHVPAGLVNTVENAIRTQLSPQGLMVIAEAAAGEETEKENSISKDSHFLTTGLAAKFRALDFVLARELLEERGYWVNLLRGDEAMKFALQGLSEPRYDMEALARDRSWKSIQFLFVRQK